MRWNYSPTENLKHFLFMVSVQSSRNVNISRSVITAFAVLRSHALLHDHPLRLAASLTLVALTLAIFILDTVRPSFLERISCAP